MQAVSSETALEFDGVQRSFSSGRHTVQILKDLSLTLKRRERVAVMGASGSGKTTLLHLAAGMDHPDAGRVILAGSNLARIGEPELTRLRGRHVGLVFQDFNLLDSLTVRENIELPCWLNRMPRDPRRLHRLAQALDIEALLERLPDQLSGGEKQRVAIARALIHGPALLLADEPTGSLDQATADKILRLFEQVLEASDSSLLMVTHNSEAANICHRVLHLRGGQLAAA